MAAKTILGLCAQVLFIQMAFSQCTSRAAVDASGYGAPYWAGPGLAYDGYGALGYNGLAAPAIAYEGLGWGNRGLACDGFYPSIAPALDFTPTSGGGLPVTSASAIPPTGISVISENAYEGALIMAGELPFVGTTVVEGILPAAGGGAINHGCGNGINAMISEPTAFAPGYVGAAFAPAAAIAPAAAAYAPGYFAGGFGLGGCGCGRELIY